MYITKGAGAGHPWTDAVRGCQCWGGNRDPQPLGICIWPKAASPRAAMGAPWGWRGAALGGGRGWGCREPRSPGSQGAPSPSSPGYSQAAGAGAAAPPYGTGVRPPPGSWDRASGVIGTPPPPELGPEPRRPARGDGSRTQCTLGTRSGPDTPPAGTLGPLSRHRPPPIKVLCEEAAVAGGPRRPAQGGGLRAVGGSSGGRISMLLSGWGGETLPVSSSSGAWPGERG